MIESGSWLCIVATEDEVETDFVVSFLLGQALVDYRVELVDDPIIHAHLESLYDTMLEQNLCRIIEPYSRVQVVPLPY